MILDKSCRSQARAVYETLTRAGHISGHVNMYPLIIQIHSCVAIILCSMYIVNLSLVMNPGEAGHVREVA